VKEVVLPGEDEERFTVDAVSRSIGNQPIARWVVKMFGYGQHIIFKIYSGLT